MTQYLRIPLLHAKGWKNDSFLTPRSERKPQNFAVLFAATHAREQAALKAAKTRKREELAAKSQARPFVAIQDRKRDDVVTEVRRRIQKKPTWA